MNLHEYQAKELLKRYNVPTQEGIAVETVEDAIKAYEQTATATNTKFVVMRVLLFAFLLIGFSGFSQLYEPENELLWRFREMA